MSTPDFELERYEDQWHDESDVYGHDHQFVYKSGTIDDIETFRSAIVLLKVGDALHNDDPTGKVAVRGFMSFPPEGATFVSTLAFETNPDQEQLTEIAHNVAELLMIGTPLLKLDRAN